MKQEHMPEKKTKGTVISSTTEEEGLLTFYETHQSRAIGRLLYGTCQNIDEEEDGMNSHHHPSRSQDEAGHPSTQTLV